jgi:hypothetical protein
MKSLLGLFGDEAMKTCVDQVSPRHSQKLGSGKIHFLNDSLAVECQIADGRKVIELGVSAPGFLQGQLASPELLVLNLQFRLVDVHLVQQFEHAALWDTTERAGFANGLFRSLTEELRSHFFRSLAAVLRSSLQDPTH